jgi:hypothetical protein
MGTFLTRRDTRAPTYFMCPFFRMYKKRVSTARSLVWPFGTVATFGEDSSCHVPNIVRLPDTPFLYLIGEFNYPVWNIATNEQSSDRTRDRWPGQVAARISSNESHFFSNILQSPQEPLNFIYF